MANEAGHAGQYHARPAPFASSPHASLFTSSATMADPQQSFDSSASHASHTPSASSPASISHASPKHSKEGPTRAAGRRTHARRSCLACRQRKARCELPDLTIPSSHDPLPSDLKCHRCSALKVDCVVWDGDRKARLGKTPRYGPPVGPDPRPSDDHGARKRKASSIWSGADRHEAKHSPQGKRKGMGSTMSDTNRDRHARASSGLATASAVADSLLTWVDKPDLKGTGDDAGRRAAADHDGRSDLKTVPRDGPLAGEPGRLGPGGAQPHGEGGGPASEEVFPPWQPGPTQTEDIRSLQYRKKLASALDRNGAQVCEILYKSPEYPARAESFTSRARGWLLDDTNPSIEQDRLNAFILANPYIDPRIASKPSSELSAATLYLKQVLAYLCDRDRTFDLIGVLIQTTICHMTFQTRARDVCQGLLLMAIYEPLNLLLPRPGEDLDETIDHAPGNCLYLAAMTIALSLGLDKSISKLSSGSAPLTPSSTEDDRIDRLREPALWLSLCNFGVLCAWANVQPNLPSAAPSLTEIEAFEAEIKPLLYNPSTSHLAAPFKALALQSKFLHRIRTFWTEVKVIDLGELSNVIQTWHHVAQLTGDVEKIEEAHELEMGALNPGPSMRLVLQYHRIERLDTVVTLTTRLTVGFSFGALAHAYEKKRAPASSSIYQVFHNASAEIRETMRSLCNVILDKAQDLLDWTGKLLPAEPSGHHGDHPGKNYRKTPRPTSLAPAPLLFVSPIFLCSAIFGAGKMIVAFSAAVSFGYGRVHHQADRQLKGMRGATEVLSQFGQGRLSLCGIMANIMKELEKRYTGMVKTAIQPSAEWDRGLAKNAPKIYTQYQSHFTQRSRRPEYGGGMAGREHESDLPLQRPSPASLTAASSVVSRERGTGRAGAVEGGRSWPDEYARSNGNGGGRPSVDHGQMTSMHAGRSSLHEALPASTSLPYGDRSDQDSYSRRLAQGNPGRDGGSIIDDRRRRVGYARGEGGVGDSQELSSSYGPIGSSSPVTGQPSEAMSGSHSMPRTEANSRAYRRTQSVVGSDPSAPHSASMPPNNGWSAPGGSPHSQGHRFSSAGPNQWSNGQPPAGSRIHGEHLPGWSQRSSYQRGEGDWRQDWRPTSASGFDRQHQQYGQQSQLGGAVSGDPSLHSSVGATSSPLGGSFDHMQAGQLAAASEPYRQSTEQDSLSANYFVPSQGNYVPSMEGDVDYQRMAAASQQDIPAGSTFGFDPFHQDMGGFVGFDLTVLLPGMTPGTNLLPEAAGPAPVLPTSAAGPPSMTVEEGSNLAFSHPQQQQQQQQSYPQHSQPQPSSQQQQPVSSFPQQGVVQGYGYAGNSTIPW
ncbi:unnamed protein product [Parajaminaea phylloscopi]